MADTIASYPNESELFPSSLYTAPPSSSLFVLSSELLFEPELAASTVQATANVTLLSSVYSFFWRAEMAENIRNLLFVPASGSIGQRSAAGFGLELADSYSEPTKQFLFDISDASSSNHILKILGVPLEISPSGKVEIKHESFVSGGVFEFFMKSSTLGDDFTLKNFTEDGDLILDSVGTNGAGLDAGEVKIGAQASAVRIGKSGADTEILGNLLVQGTTTTIESTTLVVEDPTILLNKEGNAAVDGGFVVRQPEDAYYAFFYDQSADEFVAAEVPADGSPNLTINGYMDLHIKDLDAAAATFTGLTVNTGVADFNAGVTASKIQIDGDSTVGRLYIVGADNEIADEANLVFASSELDITGSLDVSATISADKIKIDGDSTVGRLYLVGADNEIADEANLVFASSELDITGSLDVSATISADKIKIDGDSTVGRLYLVGADNEIADEANLVFASSELDITGSLDVSATISADKIKIDGDSTVGRLYLVGADNEIADEANLVFASSELDITGSLDVSATISADKIKIDGDSTVGRLYLVGADNEIADSDKLSFADGALTVTGDLIVTGSMGSGLGALPESTVAKQSATVIANGQVLKIDGAVSVVGGGYSSRYAPAAANVSNVFAMAVAAEDKASGSTSFKAYENSPLVELRLEASGSEVNSAQTAGAPVYLSAITNFAWSESLSAGGVATMTAPTAAGSSVVLLGVYAGRVDNKHWVRWAPAFLYNN